MLKKKVFVNDQLIGEARTWGEVYALIKQRGILFVNKPGAAEGPSGFYISGAFTRHPSIEAAQRRAKIKPVK
jgi:hypothetical protein